MAIKDAFTDNWDETHAEAHIKLNTSTENWVQTGLVTTYFVYKTAAQAAAGKPPIAQNTVRFTKEDASEALKQAGKAYRDALTLAVKEKLFQTGTIVADSDSQ
jgi:hypothetical protein